MSVLLDITHTTRYRFAQPVQLGEHRVMFRPRDSHDLRVLATDLAVNPAPADIRLVQDVFSNSIAIVQPATPATELELVASFTVEHTGTRALDLPLDASVQCWPFQYAAQEQGALAAYLAPTYDDPAGTLGAWARAFAGTGGGTLDILVAITGHIRHTMLYQVRHEEGVQTPYETLARGSGTCRDFATLMLEAVRHLGFAARFVSGYLYSQALDPGQTGNTAAGATHAWVQVYLPGAGWLPFDPTNNLIGGNQLVRVGVAQHAGQAQPVSGLWYGFPGDFLGMDVDVQVRQRA